jgi:hypothetical protein
MRISASQSTSTVSVAPGLTDSKSSVGDRCDGSV